MKSSTRDDHEQRILAALIRIQTELDETLSIEDLARTAALSPFHFQRVFRAIVGESVAEHVRRLRLERAAHRLRAGASSILELALEARYDSHEAFTRAFRSAFDVPPSEFRSDVQRAARVDSASRVHWHAGGERPSADQLRDLSHLMHGRIARLEPIRVAFVRHVGPYEEAAGAFGRLEEWATSMRVDPQAQRIGVPRDNPGVTAPSKLRFDACVVVGASTRGEAHVGIQDLDGGEYAIAFHIGPFDTLAETYAWLAGEWLPAQGRTMDARPCLELYPPGALDLDAADRVTELRVPVVPRPG